jgi:hypothetical protein
MKADAELSQRMMKWLELEKRAGAEGRELTTAELLEVIGDLTPEEVMRMSELSRAQAGPRGGEDEPP